MRLKNDFGDHNIDLELKIIDWYPTRRHQIWYKTICSKNYGIDVQFLGCQKEIVTPEIFYKITQFLSDYQ